MYHNTNWWGLIIIFFFREKKVWFFHHILENHIKKNWCDKNDGFFFSVFYQLNIVTASLCIYEVTQYLYLWSPNKDKTCGFFRCLFSEWRLCGLENSLRLCWIYFSRNAFLRMRNVVSAVCIILVGRWWKFLVIP